MPNEFHHHPDGFIYVRTVSGGTYADTVAHFTTDSGGAPPALPSGATEQIYTQGVRHAFIGGGNVVAGGAMPFAWADTLFTNIANLLSAQQARESGAPPFVPPPPSGGTTTRSATPETLMPEHGPGMRPPSGPTVK
jgi:hypothetical protein